ncbi:hypothetical protein AML62_21705 [Escherichia coli]|nr:hypothetical protein AML62_21705 [Escherichia coli]
MSNNPLEAVTQAVNSLVTALKLPDESAKANEILGEMSFPQFSRLLPYRDYNQESGLFMNDTTLGFMLEAIPINGANESIVEALDHMLRTKLPRGIPLCTGRKTERNVWRCLHACWPLFRHLTLPPVMWRP